MTEQGSAGSRGQTVKSVVLLTVVLILFVVACLEIRAKVAHSSAMNALDELIEKSSDESTLDAVDNVMILFPAKKLLKQGETRDVYLYSWFSILNGGSYKISVFATKDEKPSLLMFSAGQASTEPVKPNTDSATPPPSGFGGAPG